MAGNLAKARELSRWKAKLRENFPTIHIESVSDDMESAGGAQVGKEIRVEAVVNTGKLSAGDIEVQLYHGNLDEDGQLNGGQALPMAQAGQSDDHHVRYEVLLPCAQSGRSGYTVRILPSHEMVTNSREMALMKWA